MYYSATNFIQAADHRDGNLISGIASTLVTWLFHPNHFSASNFIIRTKFLIYIDKKKYNKNI